MIWMTLSTFAAPPTKLEIDFDGDGKTESAWFDDNAMTVHVGKQTLPCDGDSCELEVHDISGSTPGKELGICTMGIRDSRHCELYTRVGGKLTPFTMPEGTYAPHLTTAGNGIVLVVDGYRQRLYSSTQKFVMKDTHLEEVKQPIYTSAEPVPLKIDRTFPILLEPAGKTAVANVRAKSVISVLGEHGAKEGWMLLRLSSGVTGWAHVDALGAASDQYAMVLGAG